MSGHFQGVVETRWLDDGRDMQLLSDFAYVDKSGVQWLAKAGEIINGASIPQSVWSIVGAPYTHHYRLASVVHDVYCGNRERPWQQTHRMFYAACVDAGCSVKQAKIMFAAVWHFGPRWHFGADVPRYRILSGFGDQQRKLERWAPKVESLSVDQIEEL